MTLVEFLTARLDEDERIARAAIADDCDQDGGFEDAEHLTNGITLPRFGDAAADLIKAFAVPRRVLREVEAKRAILGELADDTWDRLYLAGLEAAVRLLAAAYGDHPDYDESWRP